MSARSATLRLVPETPSSQRNAELRPTALSEEALVRGLKAGDPNTCDRIYRLYAREVWRMLHRILGDDSDLDPADFDENVILSQKPSLDSGSPNQPKS